MLYPHGFDPTTTNPLQNGNDTLAHVPSTNGALDEFVENTRFNHVPDVSDAASKNDYWVQYPHPNTNTEIYTTAVDRFIDFTIKDFVKQEITNA